MKRWQVTHQGCSYADKSSQCFNLKLCAAIKGLNLTDYGVYTLLKVNVAEVYNLLQFYSIYYAIKCTWAVDSTVGLQYKRTYFWFHFLQCRVRRGLSLPWWPASCTQGYLCFLNCWMNGDQCTMLRIFRHELCCKDNKEKTSVKSPSIVNHIPKLLQCTSIIATLWMRSGRSYSRQL